MGPCRSPGARMQSQIAWTNVAESQWVITGCDKDWLAGHSQESECCTSDRLVLTVFLQNYTKYKATDFS